MPKWTLVYYNAKVAAQIDDWPRGILSGYLRTLETMLEHGPNLGMPHTRAMGGWLFEVRAKGHEGIGRAFYCMTVGKRIVILHAIVKKTERTPARELEMARRRLKETIT